MASADVPGGGKGLVAERIQQWSGGEEEEEVIVLQLQETEEPKREKKEEKKKDKKKEEEEEKAPATMVAKTKDAVRKVEKLLAEIREASGKEKSGKIAFLREDQTAVKNATYDILSQVQRLMLIILEAREGTRQAEEGRREAVELAKKEIAAAKVSGRTEQRVSVRAEPRVTQKRRANEPRPAWQGARPRTGVWANQGGSREGPLSQGGPKEARNGNSWGEREPQQGSAGSGPLAQGAAGGWTKVAAKTERMKKATPEVQETVVKIAGKTGAEVKALLSKKLNMEEMGGPLERVMVKKDGSVVLVSGSKGQREKVEAQVRKTCGEMEVREGTKLRPTVTITVMEDMKAEEIVSEVFHKNGWVKEGRTWETFQKDFKILAKKPCKKDKTKSNVTFCVEPVLQKSMVERGRVVVGLTRCFLEEVIAVTRCFQCNEYGHKAKDCKQQQTCMRCGEEGHRSNECRATGRTCSNCVKAGMRADHHVLDDGCPIYRRKLEAKVSRTARC